MQQYQSTSADPLGYYSSRAGLVFPDFATPPPPSQPLLIPWTTHSFDPTNSHHHDPFFFPSAASYAGLFTRRPANNSLQFAYDFSDHHHHLRLLSDAELNKMSAQELMDAKALAASKSHSEAERRRRERINNHFAKLRSLLPNTTKTDKASLLAEVIQHVKELRRQTSIIAEASVVPTEADELTVDAAADGHDGRLIIRASLCCDDRSDLLPDLIKALKSLRLRTLKAEITTLGGRVKNVLFITYDPTATDDDECLEPSESPEEPPSIRSVQEVLKAVIEKGGNESTANNAKRQRTANVNMS
ncbi:hypothetical protein Cgig2_010736 [Carnegiea gigantea]|uniref:BHLH domain-containing protein n=1 Tax=Carnegiea gigantea TaxID=171969 RepID=A0A9Q1QJX0_9CARY|nr:hypothetical protein Cgig2_010736 [Carnegiea gigantea]